MTVLPCNLQSDSILSIDMRFRNAPLENPISNSVPQAILFLAGYQKRSLSCEGRSARTNKDKLEVIARIAFYSVYVEQVS